MLSRDMEDRKKKTQNKLPEMKAIKPEMKNTQNRINGMADFAEEKDY